MPALDATIHEFRLEFDPVTYPGQANVFLTYSPDTAPHDMTSVNLGAFDPADIPTQVVNYATAQSLTFTQVQIK